MSEETETPETPASKGGPTPHRPPTDGLRKDSDFAPRPGFRAPANAKSKAQKKAKKKKK